MRFSLAAANDLEAVSGQLESCRLSVVIASYNAATTIAPCLRALETQSAPVIDEIIVADSSSDGTDQIVRQQFPYVTLLHFSEPLTLPQLRAKGIAVTRGEIIAIVDPYSIADRQWAQQLLRAHRARPNWVIGGTVELHEAERQGVLAWAQYINEYGMFMPPLAEGPIEILPGSNISYKRAALFTHGKFEQDEFWKTFVNWNAEAAGSALWLAPDVRVHLWKPIPFLDFWRTRYDHGRCFAGMRVAGASGAGRMLRAASTMLLPYLFIWRWGRRYWAKKRYRAKFVLTLPLQWLLFGNWALGEFVGYLRGVGKSCQKLFY